MSGDILTVSAVVVLDDSPSEREVVEPEGDRADSMSETREENSEQSTSDEESSHYEIRTIDRIPAMTAPNSCLYINSKSLVIHCILQGTFSDAGGSCLPISYVFGSSMAFVVADALMFDLSDGGLKV